MNKQEIYDAAFNDELEKLAISDEAITRTMGGISTAAGGYTLRKMIKKIRLGKASNLTKFVGVPIATAVIASGLAKLIAPDSVLAKKIKKY